MGTQPRSRSKLGMDVLMWVSHTERPLHVDELCHALGVEGSTDLDIRNIPTIETLLACSLGLVTVEKSSSTVRLVHYTLQEYLSYCPNFFLKPHSMIAEVCLTYLNFRQVRGFSPALRSVPPTAPFVEYASCHWGTHARRETTENVKALALKLLDGYDKHISSKLVLMHGVRAEERPFDGEDTPRGFTGLHGGAYLGSPEIIVALLETNKWDVGARDFHGHTAISWAARRGHEEVVRILLERSEVNPNTPDTEYGRVPLSWAAGSGHQGVVRTLLGRGDTNPDIPDTKYGRTPLSWAAGNGHEGIVKILLERNDLNPEKVDKSRKSPLYRAVANEHQSVVRVLLERGRVNHDTAETVFGRTLLLWAAERGHEGVVKILLERNDVDPNKAGYGRKTALWLAANNGHVVVVRMLLEQKDVNVNQADTWNRTPLSRAAENGHEGVVRMLLGRDGVSVDEPDSSRGTPLLRAVENGHLGIVMVLLERPSANPNTLSTKYGRTLVSWAARNGHEVIVKTLLTRTMSIPACPTPSTAEPHSSGLPKMGMRGS